MSDDPPRASALKVTLAVLAVPILTAYGCSLIATGGAGYSGQRGPWELMATTVLVVAAMLAFYCYSLAFKTQPSFTIHGDRLEHFRWKRPIYFKDVEAVVFQPADHWARRTSEVHLRLSDGTLQYIPTALMTHGPRAFATLLQDALDRYREDHPPLS